MRYVIRDFTIIDGIGFAVVHVDAAYLTGHDSTCDVLRRYTAHAEAYQLDDGSGLSGSEYDYRETSVEAAEAAHRRRFEVDFPMRRHECVARHQEWLAGLVALPELADELGRDAKDMDDLSDRFEATNPDHPLFTQHQRDGQWLLEPRVADHLRRHVADHPDEYHRRPVPTIEVPLQVTWTPKTWTESTSAPCIPVFKGLTFQQYESEMQVTYLGERLGHVNDLYRGMVVDPYSHRYAVITAGFGECPRMWVCDGEIVTMTTHPSQYSFDLYRMANHTLTSLAFQEGHRAGTLDEYWARDDRARRAMEDDQAAAAAAAAGTTPAGETTNLTASIKFAEASASSAQHVANQVQAVTASLTAAGVSGEPLRLAGTAMELADMLGTTFDELGGELQRHTVVAESYAAVGDDAGDKQFNQAT